MKASNVLEVKKFQDIPNVGPAMASDFTHIGIKGPKGLIGKDPYLLYKKLCKVTHTRHDPCVLDTFIAVTDFMNGAPALPWWSYTNQRKKKYPDV